MWSFAQGQIAEQESPNSDFSPVFCFVFVCSKPNIGMRCVLQNYIIYKHNIAHINYKFSSSHIKKDKKETNEIYLNNIPYLSQSPKDYYVNMQLYLSFKHSIAKWLLANGFHIGQYISRVFCRFYMNTISCFPFPQMEWQKENLFWNKQERAGLHLVQKQLIKRLHEKKLLVATNWKPLNK